MTISYVIGQNCHIKLTHPDVNGGLEYGFLCQLNDSIREGGVQLLHEVKSFEPADPDPAFGFNVYCKFDVLCANNAKNPNGSKHLTTRQQDYDMLQLYLAKQNGIDIETPAGLIMGYGAWGYSADERLTPSTWIVKCNLNNLGYWNPPVDPERVFWSCWWDTGGDPGAPSLPYLLLTWDTSFWR